MAMDKRVSKKLPDYYRREESAIRLDSGPYIGKIKNNLDPTRSGRVQVYIPDLASGDEHNPDNWRTVSYASPFLGSTAQPDTNKQNTFSKVKHTYGMWAVSPDVDNLVLCTFVAGDPNRGFWFACIPNQLGHHMLPGNAGSYNVDSKNITDPAVQSAYSASNPTVVAEFNENDETVDWAGFVNLKKPIHEELFKTYLKQGLETDYVRGIISSSSQRESPSYVFGISTPGRPANDPAQDPTYLEKMRTGKINESDYKVASRKGGHSFVMDDGNIQDQDRLVRLRTAGGHQILMNDSERVLYIGNSDGSVWIELTGPGHLNIYTGNSVNVRAQGDLNFHADNNINLNAGKKVNISGQALNFQGTTVGISAAQDLTMFGGKVGLGSGGSLDINASGAASYNGSAGLKLTGSTISLNNGAGGSVKQPAPLKINKLSDSGKTTSGSWKSVNGSLSTIVPIAPSHEPWSLHAATVLASSTAVVSGASTVTFTGSSNSVTSGPAPTASVPVVECAGGTPSNDPGPKAAQTQGVSKTVSKSYITRSDAPTVTAGVGPLNANHIKALVQQIGWSESGCKYEVTNQLNYCGKYQFGAAALTDLGYIKRDAYALYGGNKSINISTSWTGKDGITSKEQFLSNGAVQEKIMIALLSMNYKNLVNNSGVKTGDDLCTIAGMLTVAHLLGAGGAKTWRMTGGGADANGTTGAMYFNRGRYAIDVLSA